MQLASFVSALILPKLGNSDKAKTVARDLCVQLGFDTSYDVPTAALDAVSAALSYEPGLTPEKALYRGIVLMNSAEAIEIDPPEPEPEPDPDPLTTEPATVGDSPAIDTESLGTAQDDTEE